MVVDASALLVVCFQEPGAAEARSMMRGGLMSSVNLVEFYKKSLVHNKLQVAKAIVQTLRLEIVPFKESLTLDTAELCSQTAGRKMSLADCVCISLAMSEGLSALTGGHAWKKLGLQCKIELFRHEN
jgi:PIN domain nuclease of toxin-antitoxin system